MPSPWMNSRQTAARNPYHNKMATPVGHTLGAFATIVFLKPESVGGNRRNRISLGLAFIFGNLADTDFLIAYFTDRTFLNHHYFSHSIPFAILVTAMCFLVLKAMRHPKSLRESLVLGSAYASHLLIDYFTDDGSPPFGIPLLWPFTDHHFMSPVLLFPSIHRGNLHDLFSLHNLKAMFLEIAVLGPAVLLAFALAMRKRPFNGAQASSLH